MNSGKYCPKWPLLSLFILIAAAITTAVVAPWRQSYRAFAKRALAGTITRVWYQPAPGAELLSIDDTERIQAVRQWLLRAEEPGYVSLPGAYCRLIITFSDGHEEDLAISTTGGPYPPLKYGVIEWGGFLVTSHDPPFDPTASITNVPSDLGNNAGDPFYLPAGHKLVSLTSAAAVVAQDFSRWSLTVGIGNPLDGYDVFTLSSSGEATCTYPSMVKIGIDAEGAPIYAKRWHRSTFAVRNQVVRELQMLLTTGGFLKMHEQYRSDLMDGTQLIVKVRWQNGQKVVIGDNHFPQALRAIHEFVRARFLAEGANAIVNAAELSGNEHQASQALWP